jgi:hypothetical protein
MILRDSSYTVVYRVGGTANCRWVRALPVGSKAEAVTMAAAVERQGYKALYQRTAYWDAIGLPEGWGYQPSIQSE